MATKEQLEAKLKDLDNKLAIEDKNIAELENKIRELKINRVRIKTAIASTSIAIIQLQEKVDEIGNDIAPVSLIEILDKK